MLKAASAAGTSIRSLFLLEGSRTHQQTIVADVPLCILHAEPWLVKNKFPPHLRELLVGVAYHALDLNEYDDQFYAIMPTIFPFNLFTMKKLIKREVYSKRIDDFTKQQDEHLDTLSKGI